MQFQNSVLIKGLVLSFIFITIFAAGCKKDVSSPLHYTQHTAGIAPDKPWSYVPGSPLTVPGVFHTDNLTQWNAWKANPNGRFDWILLGDSYTQGNYYSEKLRLKTLADGYQDGGPGYCSFDRWNIELYSRDGSIEATEFDFNYDRLQWSFDGKRNTFGPCGHVSTLAPDAIINLVANEALNSVTLIYERHVNAGSFRYRVNGGSWTTVSDNNSISDIGNTVIDVSAAGNKINIDVDPLNTGMIFCGALAKKTGNVLTMHKCGASGAPSYMFAANDLWSQSTKILTPKGVLIEFGINEQIGNVPPDETGGYIQNIINKVRALSPGCDIIIVSPPQNTFDYESPRKYKLAAYTQVLSKLADDNKAAFIDLSIPFGSFSQASVDKGLFGQDRIHPGTVGSELIASTIYGALRKIKP